MNPDIDDLCHNLQVGQVLCLGTKDEDCTTTRVVESGDSCDSIMQAASINSTVLYHNNPQLDADCTNLYVGEVRISAFFNINESDLPSTSVRSSVLLASSLRLLPLRTSPPWLQLLRLPLLPLPPRMTRTTMTFLSAMSSKGVSRYLG